MLTEVCGGDPLRVPLKDLCPPECQATRECSVHHHPRRYSASLEILHRCPRLRQTRPASLSRTAGVAHHDSPGMRKFHDSHFLKIRRLHDVMTRQE